MSAEWLQIESLQIEEILYSIITQWKACLEGKGGEENQDSHRDILFLNFPIKAALMAH